MEQQHLRRRELETDRMPHSPLEVQVMDRLFLQCNHTGLGSGMIRARFVQHPDTGRQHIHLHQPVNPCLKTAGVSSALDCASALLPLQSRTQWIGRQKSLRRVPSTPCSERLSSGYQHSLSHSSACGTVYPHVNSSGPRAVRVSKKMFVKYKKNGHREVQWQSCNLL